MDLGQPATVPSAPSTRAPEGPAVEEVSNAALLSGFTETAVFQNLTNPIAVRFAANGKVFVAEENGRIYFYDSLSDTSPTLFIDLRSQVNSYWDRGLLGFTIDPNFANNKYVYALYTHDRATNGENNQSSANRNGTDNCPSPPGGTSQGCITYGLLVRIQDPGSGYPRPLSSVQTLVDEWPQQFPSHAVGALNFGPDGFLYATAGDGASFSTQDWGQFGIPVNPLGDPPGGVGGSMTSPTSRGGALRSQSLRRNTGENVVLNGTVIRIDPVSGSAATGNPNLSHPDADAKRIIAIGLRNPYRSTFHPVSGDLWIGDVGGNAFEEINRLTAPLTGATRNFGWPCREGPNASSNWTGFNMCSSPPTFVAPHYSYAHDTATFTGDGCTTVGSSAVSGLAFYPTSGGNYPTSYRNALFYSDVTRKCIWYMTQDPDPTKPNTPLASSRKNFITNANNPVDLQIGPNNDLFYVDYGGSGGQGTNAGAGKVWRVRFQSPTAIATANPTSGFAPLTVQYTGSMSTPGIAGDTLSYAWDLDGDGQYDDSTAINPSRTYNTAATFNARLRVTDQRGGVGESTPIQIVVGNTTMPPVPVIDTPSMGLTWKVGDTISFSGSATDPEDGTIPASGLLWDVIMQHCPATCHEHLVQSFDGVASGSFPAPDHEYPSYLQLRLTATDSHGVRTTVTRDLQPQTVQLTLNAVPALSPGLNIGFNLDGSFATPFTRTVILGSLNTLIAPTQSRGSTQYTFQSWSNGGAGSQTITANADATYTATFNATVNPWLSQDVGAVAAAGSWSESGGVHTVRGNGADIWTGADEFRFTYQQLTGDGTITARLTGFTGTGTINANAKAGVMIRQDLTAGSPHLLSCLPPQAQTTLIKQIRRTTAGATSVATTGNAPSFPRWVRATRTGNSISTFESTNGTTWTQVGTAQTISTLGASAYFGMAVSSHVDGTNYTATFDNVTVMPATPPTPPPAPAGLMATAGNAQVALSWSPSTGATSYTVLRSTTMGSGYASVQTGITGTSFTNTMLTNGTTYYYVVRAVNGAGASGNSNEASATPQLPLPGSPTNLVATAGNAQVALSWLASSGAASYTVKRSLTIGGPYTDFVQPGITGTSYTNTGLTNGTTYYYVVTATNTTGESGNSNQASATPQAPPPPSAPTGLAAVGGNQQVALTWNAVSGASSYTVKRSLESGGPYDDFVSGSITGTSYTDTTLLDNGVTYYYVVTASNSNGESGNSNQVSVTPQPAPAAPTGLMATAGNAQVALTWTASAGATSYRVKRATAAGGPYTSVQAGITTTSFTNTGLTNGTTYYYVVTASTGSAESGDSGESSATPQPAAPGAPTGLVATAGNAQVALTWNAVSGATSYTVKRSTTSGGPYTDVQSGVTVTNFTNTGLTNGTTYYYVVSASNGGGEGPNSSQVSATPASGPTWFEVNVGGATPTGSYAVAGGVHTIVGGGADFQGNAVAGQADQFKWVYREITGNATITARLRRLDNVGTQTFVKGGVMMRASTDPTAMYACALSTNTAANDFRYQRRLTAGAAVTQDRGLDSAIPSWLRLVRNGNTVTAFSSTNGTTWTQIGTAQTIALPSTYQIGFAVTSHQQGTSTTAEFESLTITTP